MSLQVSLRHRLDRIELDLRFHAAAGGITALFGASGCGKTSTINAVAGLLRPDHGYIRIHDRTLLDTDRGVDVPARRRRIGYVFQDARLFPHLDIRQNLLFGWRRAAQRQPQAEIERIVDMLDLAALMRARPTALSGGERQRVAIGRALLSSPGVLLLDEPMAGLDHKRRDEILPYLERLRDEQGIPMLYVSHSIEEVARLADEVLVLDGGRLVAAGNVSQIFSRIDLFPLTGRFEAGAVLSAELLGHEPRYGLSRVGFSGGELLLPSVDAAPGATLRLRVRARDVLLARRVPVDIATPNVLASVVQDVRADPGPFTDVQLRCGEATLLARVTSESLERLSLRPGSPVHAVIKPEAIEHRISTRGPSHSA
jgi:molybdate transport system ATP-binding protein